MARARAQRWTCNTKVHLCFAKPTIISYETYFYRFAISNIFLGLDAALSDLRTRIEGIRPAAHIPTRRCAEPWYAIYRKGLYGSASQTHGPSGYGRFTLLYTTPVA